MADLSNSALLFEDVDNVLSLEELKERYDNIYATKLDEEVRRKIKNINCKILEKYVVGSRIIYVRPSLAIHKDFIKYINDLRGKKYIVVKDGSHFNISWKTKDAERKRGLFFPGLSEYLDLHNNVYYVLDVVITSLTLLAVIKYFKK